MEGVGAVAAVVALELVVLAVEGEAGSGEAVGESSDELSEVGRVGLEVGGVPEAEEDIGGLAVAVGGEEVSRQYPL